MIERRTVLSLTLSASALVGILLHEGYSDKAYTPVKGDVHYRLWFHWRGEGRRHD